MIIYASIMPWLKSNIVLCLVMASKSSRLKPLRPPRPNCNWTMRNQIDVEVWSLKQISTTIWGAQATLTKIGGLYIVDFFTISSFDSRERYRFNIFLSPNFLFLPKTLHISHHMTFLLSERKRKQKDRLTNIVNIWNKTLTRITIYLERSEDINLYPYFITKCCGEKWPYLLPYNFSNVRLVILVIRFKLRWGEQYSCLIRRRLPTTPNWIDSYIDEDVWILGI